MRQTVWNLAKKKKVVVAFQKRCTEAADGLSEQEMVDGTLCLSEFYPTDVLRLYPAE